MVDAVLFIDENLPENTIDLLRAVVSFVDEHRELLEEEEVRIADPQRHGGCYM
jgi:hypothetical protein